MHTVSSLGLLYNFLVVAHTDKSSVGLKSGGTNSEEEENVKWGGYLLRLGGMGSVMTFPSGAQF